MFSIGAPEHNKLLLYVCAWRDDQYEKELRGFYLPVGDLPGEVVTSQSELVKTLKDFDAYQKRTKQAINAIHKRFNYLDDGNAARRVIDAVWGKS